MATGFWSLLFGYLVLSSQISLPLEALLVLSFGSLDGV